MPDSKMHRFLIITSSQEKLLNVPSHLLHVRKIQEGDASSARFSGSIRETCGQVLFGFRIQKTRIHWLDNKVEN